MSVLFFLFHYPNKYHIKITKNKYEIELVLQSVYIVWFLLLTFVYMFSNNVAKWHISSVGCLLFSVFQ